MASSVPGRIGGKSLTAELRKLAVQAVSIDDEGNPITREAALAKQVWQRALGWVEIIRDDVGNRQEVQHKPESWAVQYLFERLEGKAPIAANDDATGIRALDKVRDLNRDRINSLASKAAGPPKLK
jgi:hypothetical protein